MMVPEPSSAAMAGHNIDSPGGPVPARPRFAVPPLKNGLVGDRAMYI